MKFATTKTLLAALSAALLPLGVAAQSPSAYEGFDYADGTNIDSQTGGSGWSDDWKGNNKISEANVVTPGLTYTKGDTLPTAGNALNLDAVSAGANVVTIRTPANQFANDSFWMSGLLELNSSVGNNFVFRALDSNGQANRIFINNAGDADGFKANILSNAGPNEVDFVTNLPEDQAIFLVLQVDLAAGSNGEVNAWINPDIGPSSPTNSIGSATLSLGADTGQINNLGVIGGSGSNHTFDEFRLGDSFESVTAIP